MVEVYFNFINFEKLAKGEDNNIYISMNNSIKNSLLQRKVLLEKKIFDSDELKAYDKKELWDIEYPNNSQFYLIINNQLDELDRMFHSQYGQFKAKNH